MKNLFFFVLTAVVGMFTQGGWATPIITSVVETGGDNEATDTIVAQWTGVTFTTTIAGEPLVGSAVGSSFSVGTFGHATPTFVDRAHRYFSDASVVGSVPIPSYLLGGEIIMSGNDNRDNASYKLDVTISRDALVYMLIDNRLGDTVNTDGPTFDATHMQWILDQGWTAIRTGNNRTVDSNLPDEVAFDEGADNTVNQYYSVYRKAFPAGTFSLFQADNTGQNMYGVVVTPAPKPPLSVGIAFGRDDNGNGGPLAADSVAGAVPQANWNNANGASGSAAAGTIVADAAGVATPTTISVEWTSPNTWASTGRGEENNGFPAGSPDRDLLKAYLDSNDTTGYSTVTVSGIPPEFTSGGYDVLVYHVGGVAGRGGAYTINGETKFGTDGANTYPHKEDPGANVTDTGTYVRFRGQYGSSFTVQGSANAAEFPAGSVNFRAPINAIQIVRNSDPNAGLVRGYVRKFRYDNIGGSVALVDLINNPKYIANQYDLTCLRTDFSANDADECDNCGLVVTGYFIPAVTGPHTFYISADDGAALYLSTDDSAANKVEIAREPVWAARRNYIGEADGGGRGEPPINVSAPINLNAGTRYYIEGAVKEGGGGDNLDVAVQGPGDAAVADGDRPIFGDRIATQVDLTGSTLAITTQPVPLLQVPEGNTATWTVAANATSPLCGAAALYQWQRNGVNIPGANSATYSIAVVTSEDHLATFRCVVKFLGIERISTSSTLEVLGRECLKVVGATASGFNTIGITFSTFINTNEASRDPFNYTVTTGGAPGPQVSSVEVAGGNKGVLLTLTEALAENTVYLVEVGGLTSLVGSDLCAAPDNQASFTSWVTSAIGGGVLFETYNVVGSLGIDDLLNAQSNFPNNPRETLLISGFDSRLVYADDSHENYAGRLRGVFIPPVSGNWLFHFRSDDPGRLYFNPNGPSAAGKIQVGDQPGCCNGFPAAGGQLSAPFALVAGQAYYVELLWREFGGGDYGQVAVALQGAAGPTVPNLGGFLVGAGAAPAGIGGGLTINQQPASLSVFANSFVTFTVQASNPNGLPVSYQWTRNGTDIPGANGPSYTFGPTTVDADNGAVFAVKAGVVGTSVVSDNATLEVKPDDVKPTVVSVSGSGNLTKLTVVFSELVDPVSAEDEFNYEVVGGTPGVFSAILGTDGKTVAIVFDAALSPDTAYQLSVHTVTDLAVNEMDAATINFRTYALRRGYTLKELYLDIAGGTVPELIASPKYPASPDLVRYGGLAELNTFDEFENYGARLSGWVTAPVSGKYHFFMSSDDAGALFLSTDATPANKVQIASEPVWNGRRDWLGTARRNVDAPENRSSTLFPDGIELVAGQSYYFEALVKEGGGGDNLAITWQLPGEGLPESGSAALSGVYVSSLVDPTGAGIEITQQPVDQTNVLIAGQPVSPSTFTVAVSATGPNSGNVFYQWERETPSGWRVIKGANGASYSITPTLADNGAKFRCEVFVPGAEAISATATLTVGQRNTPPSFTLNPPPVDVNANAGPQSIAGVATNIKPGSGAGVVQQVKITAAGDPIVLVNGENDGDADSGAPPAAESVERSIDGFGQKYLNFLDLGSGFSVTPAFGSSIVTGVRFYTANDAEPRDPASYLLEGATSPDGPWTVISSGPLALPAGRNAGGTTVALDPNVNFNQAVQFGNLTAYTSYRVTFPTLKDAAAANSMQIGEVELLGSPASQPDPEAGQIVHFNVSNDNPSLFAVQPAIDNNGRLTYTPAANANGTAIVTVEAQDDGGTANGGDDTSDPQTFRLNIIGGNRCPVLAQIDQVILDEDTNSGETNRVVGTDPDGNPLTYLVVTPPAYGTLVLNPTTGVFIYTPRANYYGPDSFWVVADDGTCRSEPLMVPLIICSVNDCPVLAEVPPIRVEEDTAANGQLFAFDPDDIREPVTYTLVTPPAHGTVELNRTTGAFTYTPASNYTGPDSFTVSATASLCDSSTKTVSVTVGPANDPPILAPVAPLNTGTNSPVNGRLMATDPENDPITYSVVTPPAHGRVDVDPATGAFVYTPDTGFTGTDTFTAVAADAGGRSTPVVVTINVGNAANRCPVAVADVGPTIVLWLCGPGPHVVAGNFANDCPDQLNYTSDSYSSHADVELDASRSTDADGDTLTYSWFVVQENGSTIALATGQKPTVCLEVGVYLIRLVVDDGQCQDTVDMEFEVVSPGEAIQSVIDQITDSNLRAKVRRPLIALLKSASACFDRALCDSGVRQLAAFIVKVHAQLDAEYPDLAEDLIGTVADILDTVECPSGP